MKKQIKKLSINKKTIANLSSSEMSKHIGGAQTNLHACYFSKKCNPSW